MLSRLAFSAIWLLAASVAAAQWQSHAPREPLLLGPVEGFTTQWRPIPERLVFPRGRSALLKQAAPPLAVVEWCGAVEVSRTLRGSLARVADQGCPRSEVAVTVALPGGGVQRSRVVLCWRDLEPGDVTVAPLRAQVWSRGEESRPPDVLRRERERSEAGERTLDVLTVEAVGFAAVVDPPEAAPLVEWRIDGRALPAPVPWFETPCDLPGSEVVFAATDAALLVRRFERPGEHVVEAGPPGAAARCRVHARERGAGPQPSSPSPGTAWKPPIFEEVTGRAGITYSGQSHGASWGFATPNAFPDVYVSHHNADPGLYLSLQGGTFVDVAPALVLQKGGDTHGAAFADFDGDGDQDLLESVGGKQGQGPDPNHLHVARNGFFVDAAALYGLDYPLGRGRTPVWMDWDGDAALDVLLVNFERTDKTSPTSVFRRAGAVFQSLAPQVDFGASGHHRYAQLADLSGDGVVEVIVHGYPYPSNVFFLGDPAPVDQTVNLGIPKVTDVRDGAIADLDGDLQPDLFLVRNRDDSGMFQAGSHRVEARLAVFGNEAGVGIAADGTLTVGAYPSFSVSASDVFVGPSGWHPSGTSFTLAPGDPSVQGAPTYAAGVDDGVFVWRDPAAGTWEVRHSWSSYHNLNLEVQTELPITGLTAIGFDPLAVPHAGTLLVRRSGAFTDATAGAGLNFPLPASSVTTGDFDNDMDLDLYVVCLGPTRNVPNAYLENLGGGVFLPRTGAAGAPGSDQGRGESVAAADYDLDGFLDLFVTNGAEDEPFFDGPDQLFHNLGNQNHWIELRLVGTASNPEGLGTRVLATAGGVTQLREQGGGMHCWSQDLPVIHFGLGPNTRVDLTLHWPSGTVQTLDDVAADQFLTVVEP